MAGNKPVDISCNGHHKKLVRRASPEMYDQDYEVPGFLPGDQVDFYHSFISQTTLLKGMDDWCLQSSFFFLVSLEIKNFVRVEIDFYIIEVKLDAKVLIGSVSVIDKLLGSSFLSSAELPISPGFLVTMWIPFSLL